MNNKEIFLKVMMLAHEISLTTSNKVSVTYYGSTRTLDVYIHEKGVVLNHYSISMDDPDEKFFHNPAWQVISVLETILKNWELPDVKPYRE